MKVKLEKVCRKIYAGGDVPKERFSKEQTEVYYVPIYANAEKDNGLYGYTDEAREKENSITVAARGTIGFTAIRTTPFYPAIRLITLVPDETKVTLKYLYYALARCKPDSSGTSIPQLTVPTIKNFEFELRSLKEQCSITQKLDLLDKAIILRKLQIEKLDLLVKSKFVEMFGDPINNPKNLEINKLKDLSELITNGNTPKGGNRNYVSDGFIFIRSQNVLKNEINLDDVVFINEKTHMSMKRSIVKHKDILITKTGRNYTENSSLGRAALYLGKDGSANINGHVYLIRLKNKVLPEFVVRILTSDSYREYIRKVCVGGIDKRQINLEHVEAFPIIVPPFEIQKQFTDFVSNVEKTKKSMKQNLEQLETLKKKLMQDYFG